MSLIETLGTIRADASIVKLLLLDNITLYTHRAFQLRRLLTEQVDDLTTFLAKEVNMRAYISIITYTMIIDGYHLGGSLLTQHSQGIIYSCTAQGRHIVTQSLVHIIHGRVDRVMNKIVHNG